MAPGDEQGRALGRFLSDEAYHKLLYGSVDAPYSDEEIARRRAEERGRELSEIWKDLECPSYDGRPEPSD